MCPPPDTKRVRQVARPTAEEALWQQFVVMLAQNKLPQALLFVGARTSAKAEFIKRLVSLCLCQCESGCGHCADCHLLAQAGHPDYIDVRPESAGKAITVDKIRSIREKAFQTPHRGRWQFFVLDPADKMNVAAANALLKVLEEPPPQTIFILLAEQVGTMLPTVLSRCQKYVFASPSRQNYLALAEEVSQDSPRGRLVALAPDLIQALAQLMQGQTSPCAVAASLAQYELVDVLWWLYLVTSQVIRSHLIGDKGDLDRLVVPLVSLSEPYDLLQQLSRIDAITKKIFHTLPINQTLALESILMGFTGVSYE